MFIGAAEHFETLWSDRQRGNGTGTSCVRCSEWWMTRTATPGCGQVTPQIGITSTPVVWLKTRTTEGVVFAVAMSKDASGNYHQRLHKVSLTTGNPLATAVEITAKYPGTGEDSSGGYALFDPKQ